MTDMIHVITGFLIGVGLVLIFSRSARQRVLRPAQDKLVGICEIALGQSSKKRENKEKVLALLRDRARSSSSGQGELSNSDIREALGISPKTVVNYLDELEREGKIEQVGDIGQGVRYRLKNQHNP
ncbi:MAG: winged helix-turn-helix transcriptional regulator [Candidatus Yanofskybacteria bacterium]|nr:winged helix-turn-helix transcriptional regulator [Candidatus Yanofskybacteria bacterium]